MKWMARRFRQLLGAIWLLVCVLVLAPASFSAAAQEPVAKASAASPPGCTAGDCGLRSSSAYGQLVIGVVQHLYNDREMRELYHWGKRTGVWRDFDDDLSDFLARNKVVRIAVGESRTPFILVTSRAEHDGAPPLAGDLVRYVPLGPQHDAEGRKAPSRFSVLAGCIAILCRTTDGPCFKNYQEGFFSRAIGVEISSETGRALPAGKAVDPSTALPRK